MGELHPDLARILVSEEAIQRRVREMAEELSSDYAGVDRLVLVGILKGAFIFLADLARQITVPHHVDFMAVSSYGKTATSLGAVRLLMDLREPVEDQHILIVEDIVDTGLTLNYLTHTLRGRQPASLRSCAFLRKKRDGVDFPIDYVGFEIPDVWVVGYGLDYADTHRTLPFVAELNESVYKS